MKKIGLVFSLIFFGATAFAQVTLSGRVLSQTDKEPLPYSTVTVVNPADNKIVSGVITNDVGRFTITIMENVNFEDLTGTCEAPQHALSPSEGSIRPLSPSGGGRGRSPETRNTHINIGTGKEISIHDLALLIARTIGYTGNIVFDADKPDGTMRKLTDVTKLHALGWHHRIEIDEGVKRLYEWYLGVE